MSCSASVGVLLNRARASLASPRRENRGGARLAVATPVPSREPTPDQTRGSCHTFPC